MGILARGCDGVVDPVSPALLLRTCEIEQAMSDHDGTGDADPNSESNKVESSLQPPEASSDRSTWVNVESSRSSRSIGSDRIGIEIEIEIEPVVGVEPTT